MTGKKINLTQIEILFKENLYQLVSELTLIPWDKVPTDVKHKIAMIFCDDIAAIVSAKDEVELKTLIDRLKHTSGLGTSTIFDGSGLRLDKYSAAMANGIAGDWCELDSGYRPALCHASLYCLPALLAEAEVVESTIEELLHALLLGYEVISRLAKSLHFEELKLHSHGSLAAIGAASAIAFLRRHSPETIIAAMNAAATMVAPTPFDHAVEGALIRNIWPGLAASNGIRAVDWAEIGIFATDKTIHQIYTEIFGATVNPNELTSGLAENWAVLDGYHKMHACCQYSHSAVEAAQSIIAKMAYKLDTAAIRAIDLKTHWKGLLLTNKAPKTTLAAKFSMEHIVSTTLIHGHAGVSAFAKTTLTNPLISELRNKINLIPYKTEPTPPNDRPATLTVTLTDGSIVREVCTSARGEPDQPFFQSDIAKKLTGILEGNYNELRIPLTAILNLEPNCMSSTWRDIAQMTAENITS